ncbi:MAG: methyltransferase domain-containing protein [Cytobacillus gottheilii]
MSYTYHDMLAAYEIGNAHPGGRRLTQELIKSLPITSTSSVLDPGCGRGETSIYLAENFHCHVSAIEQNKQMADLARKNFQENSVSIDLHIGNVESMPFKDKSFHYILAESITAFTNVKKTLLEYERVLKPTGILLMNEMTIEEELLDIEKDELTQFYGMKNLYTENDWKKKLAGAGFNTVEIIEGKTILQELEEYIPGEEDSSPPRIHLNKELEEMMAVHQELTLHFAEVLGYRVFRVTK